MEYLHINNYVIPYNITKKANKNTYFYFKNSGYIQVNLSKYQSKVDAIAYIKNNAELFIKKLKKTNQVSSLNENMFYLFGKEYEIVPTEDYRVSIDHEKNLFYLPTTADKDEIIKQFYKQYMNKAIHQLHEKHKYNPYVDLTGVTYSTRYTNTRHGSCNARKRRVNLNLHLVKYDVKFLEYVYLHEIAHFIHQNHSSSFYELLKKLSPNYKEIRNELKTIYR